MTIGTVVALKYSVDMGRKVHPVGTKCVVEAIDRPDHLFPCYSVRVINYPKDVFEVKSDEVTTSESLTS